MPNRIVQCNLARCWDVQHLLHKHMAELNASICAVSEPRNIPKLPQWFGSGNGLAAVYWSRTDPSQVCRLVWKFRNCVVVEFLGIFVVSCYISPNSSRADFLSFIDDLEMTVGQLGGRTLVCGDFNAKSTQWGCASSNPRGLLIEE